jgi:hypothetical protein
MHGFKLRHMQLQLWLHIKDFARSPQRNANHIDSIFPRFFSQYQGSQHNHNHDHNFKLWCRVHKVMDNIFEGHTSDQEPRYHASKSYA